MKSDIISNEFIKDLFGTYRHEKSFAGRIRNFLYLPLMDAVIGFSFIFTILFFIKMVGWIAGAVDSASMSSQDLVYAFGAFILLFTIRLILNLSYSFRPRS